MIEIHNFCREVYSKYFESNPMKLSGSGVAIQIDESCFLHKPKFHRGRAPIKPLLVFGILDTSTTPSLRYMEIVEARNAHTLLPIIRKVVYPQTIVHSDQWKAYHNIEKELGLSYHTVNHSINFVDKTTGMHPQAIESY